MHTLPIKTLAAGITAKEMPFRIHKMSDALDAYKSNVDHAKVSTEFSRQAPKSLGTLR